MAQNKTALWLETYERHHAQWAERRRLQPLHKSAPGVIAKDESGAVATSLWAALSPPNLDEKTIRHGKNGEHRIRLLDIQSIQDVVLLVGPEYEGLVWQDDFANGEVSELPGFPWAARSDTYETDDGWIYFWKLDKARLEAEDEATGWVATMSMVAEIIRLMMTNSFWCYYEKTGDGERIFFEPIDPDEDPPMEAKHGW